MNPQQLGALMVLLSAAGFATLAIFIKLAYAAGANTLTILTLRFTLASLMLWAILKPMGLSPRMDKRRHRDGGTVPVSSILSLTPTLKNL